MTHTPVVDWQHPAVIARARTLAGVDAVQTARRCFEWVRDEIRHSKDHGLDRVTCSASEVLAAGSGLCFAKSHLLAALLRANGLPAGFCYQRLRRDDGGGPFTLHGLGAAALPGIGWYRIDPRGNRADVDAKFTPPTERLAFPIRSSGEADLPGIGPDPLQLVVVSLRGCRTVADLWDHLPDLPLVDGTRTTDAR
jgi:transglutaminase-like putative cysteine protease